MYYTASDWNETNILSVISCYVTFLWFFTNPQSNTYTRQYSKVKLKILGIKYENIIKWLLDR